MSLSLAAVYHTLSVSSYCVVAGGEGQNLGAQTNSAALYSDVQNCLH